MSTIPWTKTRSAIPDGAGRIFQWLAIRANNLAAFWTRREAIKALQTFDDRQLRDIGIERSHIEAAVKGFANRDIESV
jgi:uncharacterized protein YjiS (DUF1127 family)